MTHKDIYTKFMIEYDKAQITSSYPSLTKYEVATLLDKAYLALIAQKLTGNNQRGVLFEGDIKAIEDIRPLIKQDQFDYVKDGPASNERVYRIKDDMLYYIQSSLSRLNKVSAIDNRLHNPSNVLLLSHNDANSFKSTSTNLPWMPNPVSYIEGDEIHVLIDPFEDMRNGGSLELTATYIKKPAKFAFSYDEDSEGGDDTPDEKDSWTVTISGDSNVYNKTNTAQYSATVVSDSGITSRAVFSIINGSEYAYITSTGKLTVRDTADDDSGQDVTIKATNMLDSDSYATKTINVRYYDSSNVDPDSGDQGNQYDKYAVDLGLTSLWSSVNLNGTEPQNAGGFFAWGEIQPKGTSGTAEFTVQNYEHTIPDESYVPGGPTPPEFKFENIGNEISNTEYDAVKANWGGKWHMPTYFDFQELCEQCTWELTTVGVIAGYKVTGPSGNNIFLPLTGYYTTIDTEPSYITRKARYLAGTLYTLPVVETIKNSYCYAYALSDDANPQESQPNKFYRYWGGVIRPVRSKS